MTTVRSLVDSVGLGAKAVRTAIKRLGIQKTGRDYVLDDTQVAAVMHEVCTKRGHPTLYDQARRRLFHIFGQDRESVITLLDSCEKSKGDLRWMITGSETAIRDLAIQKRSL